MPQETQNMNKIVTIKGNKVTRIHNCAHHVIKSTGEDLYVLKPTQFFTNAPMVAAEIERKADKISSNSNKKRCRKN